MAVLRLWEEAAPRVGITSFTVGGTEPGLIAQALAERYGIGVRSGKFCAHPLVRRLTGGGDAVRVSFGLGTTSEHIGRLIVALGHVCGRALSVAKPFS
jgi:selenocysteine lyase/cysteine desulfurase